MRNPLELVISENRGTSMLIIMITKYETDVIQTWILMLIIKMSLYHQKKEGKIGIMDLKIED